MSNNYDYKVSAEAEGSRRRGNSSRGSSAHHGGRQDPSLGAHGRPTAARFNIPMLFFEPATGKNNFKEFKEAADMAAAAEYPGAAGELIRNGKYSISESYPMPISFTLVNEKVGDDIVERRVDNPTHAAEMYKFTQRTKLIEQQTEKLALAKPGVWQLLWSNITDSSRSVLGKLPNWGAIWEAKDPLELWKAIVLSHLDQVEMSPALQLYGALKKLFAFRSNPNEDLFDYQQRYEEIIERLDAAKKEDFLELLPEILVWLFMDNLAERFAPFKVHVRNAVKSKIMTFPSSTNAVYSLASEFLVVKPDQSFQPLVNQRALYVNPKQDHARSSRPGPARGGRGGRAPSGPQTDKSAPRPPAVSHGDGVRDKSTFLCNSCKQPGHYARDCPNAKAKPAPVKPTRRGTAGICLTLTTTPTMNQISESASDPGSDSDENIFGSSHDSDIDSGEDIDALSQAAFPILVVPASPDPVPIGFEPITPEMEAAVPSTELAHWRNVPPVERVYWREIRNNDRERRAREDYERRSREEDRAWTISYNERNTQTQQIDRERRARANAYALHRRDVRRAALASMHVSATSSSVEPSNGERLLRSAERRLEMADAAIPDLIDVPPRDRTGTITLIERINDCPEVELILARALWDFDNGVATDISQIPAAGRTRMASSLHAAGYRDYIHDNFDTSFVRPTNRERLIEFVEHQHELNMVDRPVDMSATRPSIVTWRGPRPTDTSNQPTADPAPADEEDNSEDHNGAGPPAPEPMAEPESDEESTSILGRRHRDSMDRYGGPILPDNAAVNQMINHFHMIPLPLCNQERAVVGTESGLVYAVSTDGHIRPLVVYPHDGSSTPTPVRGHDPNNINSITNRRSRASRAARRRMDYISEQTSRLAMMASTKQKRGKRVMILDSGATDHIFRNSEALSGMRDSPCPMEFSGLSTTLSVAREGDHPHFGRVFHSPNAVMNIVSQSRLTKNPRCHISYDPDHVLRRYTVTFDDSAVYCFDLSESGLWECDLAAQQREFALFGGAGSEFALFGTPTVSGNMAKYNVRELAGVQRAMKGLEQLACSSFKDLATIADRNTISGIPFSVADVRNAQDIYGLHVPSVKGKTTRKHTTALPFSTREPVDPVHRDQTLVGDIMDIDGDWYFVTESVPMGYTQVTTLPNKTQQTLRKLIEVHVGTYSAQGYQVSQLRFDSEPGIAALVGKMDGLTILTAASGEHSPVIERMQRTIKERVRSVHASLAFTVPLSIAPYLVLFAVSRLNLLPSKSFNDGICAQERLTGYKPSYAADMNVRFGEYGQSSEYRGKTNSMHYRTMDVITLLPVGNVGGDIWCLHLDTWHAVRRKQLALLPMPDSVITLLNSRAALDLKAANRQGVVQFHEDDWGYIPDDLQPIAVAPDSPAPVQVVDSEVFEPNDGEDLWQQEPMSTVRSPTRDNAPSPSISRATFSPGTPLTARKSPKSDVRVSPASPRVAWTDTDTSEEREPQTQRSLGTSDFDSEDLEDPVSSEPISEPGETKVSSNEPTRSMRSARSHTWKDGPAKYSSMMIARAEEVPRTEYGLNISAKKSLATYGDKAKGVMVSELQQMLDRKVFEPVLWSGMTADEKKNSIRSMIFLKEKFLPDGSFDKLKARLVAGGHMQLRELYSPEDTSSPTVRTSSVFIIAIMAALEKKHVVSVDIAGAYLNAQMTSRVVHMIIDPLMSKYLCELDPSYTDYLRHDGTIVVQLLRALYGCIESAKLWYEHLKGTLVKLGFRKNQKDECVFTKIVKGKQITVCFHVDDLLITCEHMPAIESLLKSLEYVYKSLTVKRGKTQSYLGMTFDFNKTGLVEVSMAGYVADCLKTYNVTKSAGSPGGADLFDIDVNSPKLSKADTEIFHSRVAKLLYLAKRTRPDLLLAIAFLTTRVQCSTLSDMKKLDRVLAYLNATPEQMLTLGAGKGPLCLHAFIDASYAPHADAKSHSGANMGFGIGSFHCSSSKQKIVTKSSWEAELVAYSDYMSEVVGTGQFLDELGVLVNIIVHQDNTSTILSTAKGAGSSNRTRHVNIRYFWTRQFIEDGTVTVQYTPTAAMIADVLTKPLQSEMFRNLRALLLGSGGECWNSDSK